MGKIALESDKNNLNTTELNCENNDVDIVLNVPNEAGELITLDQLISMLIEAGFEISCNNLR